MPSMVCGHCTKVKRCKMYLELERETQKTLAVYLCNPCARELDYTRPGR